MWRKQFAVACILVLAILTWIWFSVAVVLVGAEIDAERTGRKKTTGSSAKVTSLGANR